MSLIQKHPKFKWLIAVGDIVASTLAILLAFSAVAKISLSTLPIAFVLASLTLIPICHVLVFQLLDLYKLQTVVNHKVTTIQVIKGVVFFGVITVGLQLVSGFGHPIVGLLYTVLLFSFLILARNVVTFLLMRTTMISDRVVIVGAGAKGRTIRASLTALLRGHHTVGFLDDHVLPNAIIDDLPVLGSINDAHKIKRNMKVDYFLMAIDNLKREEFHRILNYFARNNLPIYISSSYLKILQENVATDSFDNFNLIRLGKGKPTPILALSKRFFDIVATLVLIVLLSPLLLAIAIAVRLSSAGPVIYQQTRIGKKGKPFTFYKFRSMRPTNDMDAGRDEKVIQFIKGNYDSADLNTKIVNQSRITKIGRIIRRTSLDELPQLFNVLRGDMSLVGPRPCIPLEWDAYEPWQKRRLDTTPGCTGIWQTKGRSKVNFEQTVLLDIYYNCNVSLWLDLKIMFNTIPVMVFSKGGE